MDIKQIGTFLQKQRKDKGWTQIELAELLGVSHQAVSRWEKGDNLPDVIKLKELSVLYNLTVDEILECHIQEESVTRKEPKEDNRNFLLLLSYVITVLAFILFYVIFFTSGKMWISVLVQYSMVIASSILYVIPYVKKSNKTKEDFRLVIRGVTVNSVSLFLTISSFFVTYDQLPWGFLSAMLIATPIIILIEILINFLMNYYSKTEVEGSNTKMNDYAVNGYFKNELTRQTVILIILTFLSVYILYILESNGERNMITGGYAVSVIFVVLSIILLIKQFRVLSLLLLSFIGTLFIYIFNFLQIRVIYGEPYYTITHVSYHLYESSRDFAELMGILIVFELLLIVIVVLVQVLRKKQVLATTLTKQLLFMSVVLAISTFVNNPEFSIYNLDYQIAIRMTLISIPFPIILIMLSYMLYAVYKITADFISSKQLKKEQV